MYEEQLLTIYLKIEVKLSDIVKGIYHIKITHIEVQKINFQSIKKLTISPENFKQVTYSVTSWYYRIENPSIMRLARNYSNQSI